jgi:hypothetical protein
MPCKVTTFTGRGDREAVVKLHELFVDKVTTHSSSHRDLKCTFPG